MSKQQVIMILGAWVIILPFLGFPSAWDTFFQIVSGLLIVGIAYTTRPKNKQNGSTDMPYVEHRSEPPTEEQK